LRWNKGVIGRWKKGASPNSDIVMELSVRLNVPTNYLLFDKEKNSPTSKLTADEQVLIGYFKNFSDKSKGIVLRKDEILAELEAPAEPIAEEESKEKETIFIVFLKYYFNAN
jgi:hypothetical protein